ncbi:MAG: hypothetical protein J3K34DRAFT_425381 [Monoraphidium minutum]|nr:MAG: hypothetical protein J3K34DRAFT_425381 [Monoraphidium minutum]
MQPAAPAASAAKPAPRAAAKPAAAAAKPLFSCPTQPMPGGLACKPANADATAAAKFAVGAVNAAKSAPGTPLTLSKVNTYATQVVAGTNYFVDFDVKDAAGATRRMQAKVFRALPVYGGKMELTASVMLP